MGRIKLMYEDKELDDIWIPDDIDPKEEAHDELGSMPMVQTVWRQVEWEVKVAGFEVMCKQKGVDYIDKKKHPFSSYVYERYFVTKKNFSTFMLQALSGWYGEIIRIRTIRYGNPHWVDARITPKLKEYFRKMGWTTVFGRTFEGG